MELNDHPDDGAIARHREGTQPVRECRWTLEPVTPGPRESDRHIGRIVQIDAWIGSAAQWDGAAEDLTGPAAPARPPVEEGDLWARTGRTQAASPLGQDAARVGIEAPGGLRQARSTGAAGPEHENDQIDPPDHHGRTLASGGPDLGRLTQSDENVMW